MSAPAKKPAAKPAAKPVAGKAGAKGNVSAAARFGWIGLFVGIALASAFFASTSLLLVAGMLPTLVALTTDRSPGKSAALSICTLNFAGTLPFVINLWRSGQGLGATLMILSEPYTWLVMYGAAGIGFAIYAYLPKFIATYVAYRAQSQLTGLQSLQKKLIDTWGPQVAVLALRNAEDKTPTANAAAQPMAKK